MNAKYLYNKKLVIVSILLITLLTITGIYLFARISYGMMNGNGGMMNGNNMMTGKMVNNMGHKMFPQYKGIKTGPALFHREGCIMCHRINGLGGGFMGPNLSHVGSIRSVSWIATQIADPSAHFKRNSIVTLNGKKYQAIMPSFKNMSSKDIGILAKYLASLK